MSDTKRAAVRGQTLDLLGMLGPHGLTWRELAAATSGHHGTASGVLSNLHKSGQVARLAERRNGCGVYVLVEHVGDRPVAPYRPRGEDPQQAADREARIASLIDALASLEAKHASAQAAMVDLQAQRDAARTAAAVAHEAATDTEAARAVELTAAVAEARATGTDEGWLIGYEAAKREMEALISDDDASFSAGLAKGRAEVAERVTELSRRMIEIILREAPVYAHHQGCFRQHPSCALKAVMKNVAVDLPSVVA